MKKEIYDLMFNLNKKDIKNFKWLLDTYTEEELKKVFKIRKSYLIKCIENKRIL